MTINKTNKQRGEKRETKQETDFSLREQTPGYQREVGGGWVTQVMGIKEGSFVMSTG